MVSKHSLRPIYDSTFYAHLVLACCSCTRAKLSMKEFMSFRCFSSPDKDDLSSSRSSSSCSSTLALFRFFFRSVRAWGLVSWPANATFVSLAPGELPALDPASATFRSVTPSLQPRTASISS